MDDYEELDQFTSLSYAREDISMSFPTRSVSVFEQLCKLSIIMDRILSELYAENCNSKSTSHLLNTARSLYQDLGGWRASLPEHLILNFDSSTPLTPHALSLMLVCLAFLCLICLLMCFHRSMFYCLIILLHRPFVSDGHITATSSVVIRDAFATCAAAASGIDSVLRVFLQRFCITTVPYFMSYATYVSGTIHVRIAAQRGRDSEAYKSLENCLDILSQQQSVCRAPRRARRILLGLARRLNIDVDDASVIRDNASADLDMPLHTSTLPQSDCDILMSGLDIDAIIQSFDFDQAGMVNQAENMNSSLVGSSTNLNHAAPTSQDADTFSQWMLQDPLFGYDSLFPLDDSSGY
jgi:hypothetical protein